MYGQTRAARSPIQDCTSNQFYARHPARRHCVHDTRADARAGEQAEQLAFTWQACKDKPVILGTSGPPNRSAMTCPRGPVRAHVQALSSKTEINRSLETSN